MADSFSRFESHFTMTSSVNGILKPLLRIKRSKRCSSLISLLYLNPESLLYSTKRYKVGARELVNEGVILPLLPAGKTGAKRLNKSASSSCCTEYPYLFAKNLKKHLKSNEVKIHQIHGILIASWFPHGLRQQHTKLPFYPLPGWKNTRNSCNELDFRAYMDFPSVFAVSVPHGGWFHFAPFFLFHFAPNILWTPTPSISRICTKEGAPVSVWAVRRDFDPPWGPPGTAL